jgi:hypothetical protein
LALAQFEVLQLTSCRRSVCEGIAFDQHARKLPDGSTQFLETQIQRVLNQ